MALDVNNNTSEDKTQIQLWEENQSLSQCFEIHKVSENEVRIRTASSGGWLTELGTVNGSKVVQLGNSSTPINDENVWILEWNNGITFKNKESLSQLFENLKYDMEHGKPGTERWFNKADLEELKEARKLVHNDLMNPALDNEYRADCHDLLLKFDQKIGEKEWEGREPKGPAYHREHGYGLYKP